MITILLTEASQSIIEWCQRALTVTSGKPGDAWALLHFQSDSQRVGVSDAGSEEPDDARKPKIFSDLVEGAEL